MLREFIVYRSEFQGDKDWKVILATQALGDPGEGGYSEITRAWGQKLHWTEFKSKQVKEI